MSFLETPRPNTALPQRHDQEIIHSLLWDNALLVYEYINSHSERSKLPHEQFFFSYLEIGKTKRYKCLCTSLALMALRCEGSFTCYPLGSGLDVRLKFSKHSPFIFSIFLRSHTHSYIILFRILTQSYIVTYCCLCKV
jgi:hypothetical protein